jgi:SAM-dependent methyltransferase
MSWKSLKLAYYNLCNKAKNHESFIDEWSEYSKIAKSLEFNPPTGLKAITEQLQKLSENLSKDNIVILDHGSGGGFKAMFCAALGYTNIYGIDVDLDFEYLNKILSEIFNISEQRFISTDGKEVPFEDDFFDFIISSQVVEHLRDDEVHLYYSEEGRVLKKGGLAYHEVPHLLIPYESHSRLWMIHLFPFFLKPLLYGVFKSIEYKKNLLPKGLHYAKHFSGDAVKLRMPGFHRKMLLNHFGEYEDLTIARLLENSDFSSYDMDSPLRLRKVLQYIFQIPVIGKIFANLLKNMFMLQTVSKKIH